MLTVGSWAFTHPDWQSVLENIHAVVFPYLIKLFFASLEFIKCTGVTALSLWEPKSTWLSRIGGEVLFTSGQDQGVFLNCSSESSRTYNDFSLWSQPAVRKVHHRDYFYYIFFQDAPCSKNVFAHVVTYIISHFCWNLLDNTVCQHSKHSLYLHLSWKQLTTLPQTWHKSGIS